MSYKNWEIDYIPTYGNPISRSITTKRLTGFHDRGLSSCKTQILHIKITITKDPFKIKKIADSFGNFHAREEPIPDRYTFRDTSWEGLSISFLASWCRAYRTGTPFEILVGEFIHLIPCMLVQGIRLNGPSRCSTSEYNVWFLSLKDKRSSQCWDSKTSFHPLSTRTLYSRNFSSRCSKSAMMMRQ